MINRPPSLLPGYKPVSRLGKVVMHPLSRLVMLFILIALVYFLFSLLENSILNYFSEYPDPVVAHILELIFVILSFFIYRYFVLIIEKRPVYELSFSRSASEMITGLFLGACFISVVVVILVLMGNYHIVQFNSTTTLAKGLIRFLGGALFEELLFRLILFRLLEEFLGSWLALTLSALFFGFAHIFNDNATLWSAVAIAIEGGILLAVAFMLTRRLWFAFGIHFGWNFLLASVFGIPTSGVVFPSLIQPEITGPVWLTGGAFGIEASVLMVILGLVVGILLLRKVILDRQIYIPVWRHKNRAEIIY